MGTQQARGAAEPAVADATVPPKGRKNPRAQVSLIARYRSPTAFEFVQEECFDLSAGGMFIKSPAPAPAGTLIKLECDIDHGAQTIRGVARVVWLREQESDGQPAGMGIKFVKLEAGGREALEAALKQLGTAASDPPEAGLRRSQPPARPGRASPRPSPPPLTRAAELPTNLPATPTAVTPSTPTAAPATKPRPLPPALPAREASAPKAEPAQPRSTAPRSATKTAPRVVQTANAAEADARGGMRTLIYSAALTLAVLAVYVTRETPKPAVQTAKLPSPAQLEAPPETPPTAPSAPTPAPAAAVPPPAVTAAVVEDKPAPEPTYVLDVATTPDGARVTVGERTVVTPATLELGTLSEPVQLSAAKEGFQSASAVVDRVGFMLDEGQMRRRISLTLVEEPKPAPVEPAPKPTKPAPRSADRPPKAKPSPTKVAAVSTSEPKPEPQPAIVQVEARPESKIEPPATTEAADRPAKPDRSAPAPSKAATMVTPMEAATACLATGDNACVVKALEGKAKSARELELLIETYRALGDSAKAEKQMQIYVDKYPTERHASGFRRVIERRQSEAASAP